MRVQKALQDATTNTEKETQMAIKPGNINIHSNWGNANDQVILFFSPRMAWCGHTATKKYA